MKIRLMYFSFRNMKKYYFITIIVLWIILPIINLLFIFSLGIESSYLSIMDTSQMLIPITSTWWVFCALKEYIEGNGNELLYLYENHGKTKIFDIILICLWYCLHVSVLYLAYALFYNNIFWQFLKTIIQCFLLTGAYYCLSYIFKSTSISFIIVLGYYIMSLFYSRETIFEYISMFSTNKNIYSFFSTKKYLVIIIVSIVFYVLGLFKNRNYYK